MNTTDIEKARVWIEEVDVNRVIEATTTKLREIVRERPLGSMAIGFLLGMVLARRSGR